jgi:hypothetical protein
VTGTPVSQPPSFPPGQFRHAASLIPACLGDPVFRKATTPATMHEVVVSKLEAGLNSGKSRSEQILKGACES